MRREDKNRWERRAPLTPTHVAQLVKEHGARILVQPSTNRVFVDDMYRQAGAEICEDLTEADVIMGIKEIPPNLILPNKTHILFSHIHKGQETGKEALRTYLSSNARLIDYELMVDPDSGKRVVLFGKHAGYAGMVDGLHGLGLRLLGLGYNSPFMYVGMSHSYRSLNSIKTALGEVGDAIKKEGVHRHFGPMTFTFTGAGNVSQGAKEMFECLPHEYVDPKDLPGLVNGEIKSQNDRLYAASVIEKDHLVKIDGGGFDKKEYRNHPERYKSTFGEKIAPYTSVLVTGAYWDKQYPRILSKKDLARIQKDSQGTRLLAIPDIICEMNGSVESVSKCTTIEHPFYIVDAVQDHVHIDMEGKGTLIDAVDNLPAEIPKEASESFSEALYPLAAKVVQGYLDDPILSRATICKEGKLTPEFSHLDSSSMKPSAPRGATSKRVLLLGSGMVSGPLVKYIMRDPSIYLTVATNNRAEGESMIKSCNASVQERTTLVGLDISNDEALSSLVSKSDLAISLVPAPLHPKVAKACIQHKSHLVTASYISPEMQELDKEAKEAGIVIMNEVGLDPGIDHMSAMKFIDQAKASGYKVTSFISWCGGLPSPEASGVPLAYKFSWSPRGVLTASSNPATFLFNGKVQEIPGEKLLETYCPNVPILPGFALEGLANRNSLSYLETYGLGGKDGKEMDTMFRGTLRFQGFSRLMAALRRLGFLSLDPADLSKVSPKTSSWMEFIQQIAYNGMIEDTTKKLDEQGLRKVRIGVARTLEVSQDDPLVDQVISSLTWLGEGNGRIPGEVSKFPSLLDGFSALLSQRLAYNPGERDLVVLSHEFAIQPIDGKGPEEVHTSSMVCYGEEDRGGPSAMAKTVGLPAGMAVELILNGGLSGEYGVMAPIKPNVYEPILEKLHQEGVLIREEKLPAGQPGMRKAIRF